MRDNLLRMHFGGADATLNSNLTAEVSRLDSEIDDETAARIRGHKLMRGLMHLH